MNFLFKAEVCSPSVPEEAGKHKNVVPVGTIRCAIGSHGLDS
jgi:hypothetical protein